ncbi:MAG TPA: beta-ketoacyl synthase N-terminal-like domain-containing protein, partial [Thermoanaerobaculia bacterium]|nr:beta-ketoacyl synthase N-terminal-like domain-containing protein [Thermoanaerobaculia bacterium]
MRKPDPNTRIAITGAGIVCAIGRDKAEVWLSIRESRDGIRKLSRLAEETFPTDLAAEVLDELRIPVTKREAKRLSRTDLLALVAANEAIEQASENAPLPRERAIVSTGTSTGGLLEGEEYYFERLVRGRARAHASRVLQQPTSGPSDAVAKAF